MVTPSESGIYEKIAAKFDNYQAQSAYQAAKRFFSKAMNLDFTSEPNFEDYMTTFDRYQLKPQHYTSFNVSIEGLPFFRNENGNIISTTDWSPRFAKIVFAMSGVPCAWSLDRPRYAGNEITINGHCLENECDAKLFAFTEGNHKKLNIRITPPNQKTKHEKKNQIRGEEKAQILEMLKTQKAMVVVSKIAMECLRIGDVEPPFMPKSGTLRKMRSGRFDDLTFDADPMVSLREMKYTEPYQKSIGDIGMDPFSVSFCTPYQQELARIETNRSKIVISFDATGVPVKPPKYSSFSLLDNKHKSIYIYVIMLQCKSGKNAAIYQFMTQRQDATNIRFMLDTWKDTYLLKKHPDEVITDAGAALVLAAVKAFANCDSVDEYDDWCYDALFDGKVTPPTFCRLDRAHIIKTIFMMLKPLDRNKHRLLSRVLGLLLLTEKINDAEKLIKNLFIVILNRYQYDEHVETAIKFLKESTDIHGLPPELVNDDEDARKAENEKTSIDEDRNVTTYVNAKTQFFSRFKSIAEKVKMTQVHMKLNDSLEAPSINMRENPFYAPEMEKKIIQFVSKIHLWGNVMLDSFGSVNKIATSACSESGYNMLKHVVFDKEKRLRCDVFTRRYIDFLDGMSIKHIVEDTHARGYSSDVETKKANSNIKNRRKSTSDITNRTSPNTEKGSSGNQMDIKRYE